LQQRVYYGWTIVVALGVTTIISYGTNQYLFGMLVDPVSRELGWSTGSIGLAYAGVVLVSGLGGVAFGRALDRLGARPLLSFGSLITGVSLLLLSRTYSLVAFDVIWTAGIGLGSALTLYPVTMTVVANWFDRRRLRALAVLTFMGAFSSTLTYPIAGLLIARLGWREAIAILGGVQLLIAFPLHALIVRRHPEDHGLYPDGAAAAGASTPASGVAFAAAMRSASFWLPTVALSLAYFASTAILLIHVAYLIARGYSPAYASALLGLFGIAYLPGRWFVAWAGERFSLGILFAGAFAIEAFGIAVLAVRPSEWIVAAYVCTFGAAYGATFPLRGAIMAQRFGRRAYGSILAAQGVPVGIASALGPIAVGRLIDARGFGAAFDCCIAALAAAAIVMAVPVRAARGLTDPAAYRVTQQTSIEESP
jgi:MFS family permease